MGGGPPTGGDIDAGRVALMLTLAVRGAGQRPQRRLQVDGEGPFRTFEKIEEGAS
jgi:hypothetical protein